METNVERRKRLGALIKGRRAQLRIKSARALAELTDNRPAERTIAAIELGDRVASNTTYTRLEIALRLPIGICEAVLRGEVDEFPPIDTTTATPVPDTPAQAEQTFTATQLRVLAETLGPDGLHEWALRLPSHGGVTSATG
ncbi:hypothetical protein [Amycolatopsis thermoflava]|uniref:hypothetical protein n=1 Tax=Amycolatopsis thermoflava TaxID=84480 RepID=UPI0012FB972C|nr:hypothetical protein [Amycolatopsis thermoflava]